MWKCMLWITWGILLKWHKAVDLVGRKEEFYLVLDWEVDKTKSSEENRVGIGIYILEKNSWFVFVNFRVLNWGVTLPPWHLETSRDISGFHTGKGGKEALLTSKKVQVRDPDKRSAVNITSQQRIICPNILVMPRLRTPGCSLCAQFSWLR